MLGSHSKFYSMILDSDFNPYMFYGAEILLLIIFGFCKIKIK